jgi:hypothetical protein
MSSFSAYNSDDTNVPAGTYPPLAANGSVTIGPIYPGIATKLAGSCYSDTSGTLIVYQSFDGGNNWDIVQYPTTAGAIVGGTPVTIDLDVLAPVVKVVFTNGTNAQAHLRLFVRAFGMNRG